MTDNKKALNESLNPNGFIITEKPSKSNVLDNMPEIVKDIVTLLQTRLIDLSFNCCLNMLIYMLFGMISSKRVYIKKHSDSVMQTTLSWYAIVFSGSGTGKDYCIKILKELIFKKYYDVWFDDNLEDYARDEQNRIKQEAETLFADNQNTQKQAYIKSELAKVRKPKTEIIQGTQEGLIIKSKRDNVKGNYNKYLLRLAKIDFKTGKNENEYKYTQTDINGQKTTNKPSENELLKKSDSDHFMNKTNKIDKISNTQLLKEEEMKILRVFAKKNTKTTTENYLNWILSNKEARENILYEYKERINAKKRASHSIEETQSLIKKYEKMKNDSVLPSECEAWQELGQKIKACRG